MNPNQYRRLEFGLTDDDEAVRAVFADFFRKECPSTRVRAAEPLGFDAGLWQAAVGVGATTMALPHAAGGDGAGIVEMTFLAEELGRVLAPVPLLEHVTATRLLAAAGDPALAGLVEQAVAGERILAIAPRLFAGRQLVSGAAVAADVVGIDRDGLVVLHAETPREHVPNQSSLPAAWVGAGDDSVQRVEAAAPQALFGRAMREWKVMAAAALTGLTEAALELGVEFATTRETLGVPIGTLQGVAFPLADVRIGVVGARNLARRAAWFLDHEPTEEVYIAAAAIAYAAQVATRGTSAAAHVQGGLGFTVEADASLYFLRAKGWALACADVHAEVRTVGEAMLADRRTHRSAGDGVPTRSLTDSTA